MKITIVAALAVAACGPDLAQYPTECPPGTSGLGGGRVRVAEGGPSCAEVAGAVALSDQMLETMGLHPVRADLYVRDVAEWDGHHGGYSMPGWTELGSDLVLTLHEQCHQQDGIFTEVHAWWRERGWWGGSSLFSYELSQDNDLDSGDFSGYLPPEVESAFRANHYDVDGWRATLAERRGD